MPTQCHRELFSTFYLPLSSVFLALQQALGPSDTSLAQQLSSWGSVVTGSLSLLRGKGQ